MRRLDGRIALMDGEFPMGRRPLRSPHASFVLQMGHMDAKCWAVGWTFLLDHLTPEQLAVVQQQTEPTEIARYAGWGLKSLREFWLRVRRN